MTDPLLALALEYGWGCPDCKGERFTVRALLICPTCRGKRITEADRAEFERLVVAVVYAAGGSSLNGSEVDEAMTNLQHTPGDSR